MKDFPEKWICAFLTGTTVKQVCEEAGISKTKYYKLRADPDFQAVIRERRDMCILSAVQALREAFLRNVQILMDISEDSSVSAQTRVNAVSVMLSQLQSWTTTQDLIERIERLESVNNESMTVLGGSYDSA